MHKTLTWLKETTAAVTLAVFILQAPLAHLGAKRALASVPATGIRAPLKSEVAEDDADALSSPQRKANVLFLIESTAAMSFSPKGVMPIVIMNPSWKYGLMEAADWVRTENKYGYKFPDIQRLMKQSTFGMGALPTAWSGQNVNKERNLYGRELVNGNNYVKSGKTIEEDMEANRDRYYFPFADPVRATALREAYSNQKTGLEVSFSGAKRPYNPNSRYPYEADYAALSSYMGTPKVENYNYSGAVSRGGEYPYALVFKDPKYWQTGWTESRTPAADDLVPNDSRMYQAKLALWRLLEDESLFRGLRIGLATTFLSPSNMYYNLPHVTSTWASKESRTGGRYRTDFNTIFKVYPYGGNIFTHRYFYKSDFKPANAWDYDMSASGKVPVKPGDVGKVETLQYSNGTLLMNITGHPFGWEGMHAQFFPVWSNTQVSTNYSMGNDPYGREEGWTDRERQLFRLENRASLHVPITDYDHEWKRTYKYKTYTISQADKIRLWINGLADIKSAGPHDAKPYNPKYMESAPNLDAFGSNTDKDNRNTQFHFYKDPEIGIAGTFALPGAIFPDPRPEYEMNRDESLRRGSRTVWYSDSANNTNYMGYFRAENIRELANPKAFFNAGSGEAAGSVMDFFSPYIYFNMAADTAVKTGAITSTKTVAVGNLADVSFPIRNTCETNWLIVIASGMEVEPVDSKAYKYNSWDAVKNLYDYTDKNNPQRGKVTVLSSKWSVQDGRNVRDYVAADLDEPIRTLVVGIVADPDDPEIKGDPLMKTQVERLRENLNRMARAGQGDDPYDTNSEYTAYFADDVPTLMAAIRSALTVANDSAEHQTGRGALTESPPTELEDGNLYAATYRIRNSNQWESALTRFTVKKDKDGKISLSPKWELGENIIQARDSGAKRPLKYWDGTRFAAADPGDRAVRDLLGLESGVMSPSDVSNGGIPVSEAFFKWLRGYDYSYKYDKEYKRLSMLADTGQSRVVYADYPVSNDSLPGYKKWAEQMAGSGRGDARLYLQTNDGILHVVNPKDGTEESAILPPPVLQPTRLGSLKTYRFEDKLYWIDAKRSEKQGDRRSNPAYTLDGSLQKRRLNLKQTNDASGWGTYLLGSLGRGGSGLYMTDVTTPNAPKFRWYREKVGNSLVSMTASAGQLAPVSESFTSASISASANSAYAKIGFNSPAPVIGVTGELGQTPKLQNFIALPGGSQRKLDLANNGNEGATLLILDPKDGSVIRAFDSKSLEKTLNAGGGVTGPAPYMGMMVSEPTLYRSDLSSYLAGRVFAADNRGNIFSVDLEKKKGGTTTPLDSKDWNIWTIATLQTSATAGKGQGSFAMPHGLAVGKNGSSLWIAGGTSDLGVMKNGSADDGIIKNEEQMIFAAKVEDGRKQPLMRDLDFKELGGLGGLGGNEQLNPGDAHQGWYIPLQEDKINRFREYVTSRPVMAGKTLFVPTFIQKKIDELDPSQCGSTRTLNGDSRLYALNLASGAGNMWKNADGTKAKFLTLKGVKITGMTLMPDEKGGSLLVTFDQLSDKTNVNNTGQSNVHRVGNEKMLQITGVSPANSGISLKDGESMIFYWLMR
ncbi:MAG: hypothetical protein LBT08_07480 [Synergistaceae bacterium]|nr:hypothetical protein [Synergistaceae bacterium]